MCALLTAPVPSLQSRVLSPDAAATIGELGALDISCCPCCPCCSCCFPLMHTATLNPVPPSHFGDCRCLLLLMAEAEADNCELRACGVQRPWARQPSRTATRTTCSSCCWRA